jgi:hypothetical protein
VAVARRPDFEGEVNHGSLPGVDVQEQERTEERAAKALYLGRRRAVDEPLAGPAAKLNEEV